MDLPPYHNNTKDIKGKWGDLKVSGTKDGFEIKHKNLAPLKEGDKKLAVNTQIRNAINKNGGDVVTVALFLENQQHKNEDAEILACLSDAQVLRIFEQLPKQQQEEILTNINNTATENQKVEKIVETIKMLEIGNL